MLENESNDDIIWTSETPLLMHFEYQWVNGERSRPWMQYELERVDLGNTMDGIDIPALV